MPVLVTAADAPLGARTVLRLLREGGEVRAYCTGDGDAMRLRSAGAVVATGDLDDEGRLEAALAEAHTLVHLGGDVLSVSADQLRVDADVAIRAAVNAGVRRIVALSSAGAHPEAPDPLRRAHAHLEQQLAAADVPTVVVRTSLVDRPELRDALATFDLDPHELATSVAPLRPGDLAELLSAFDAARSTAQRGHVVFAADGPVRTTVAGYLERVGVAPSGTAGRFVGRVYRPATAHPLLRPSLAAGWVASSADVPDAWEFARIRPAPIGVDDA